MPESQSSNIPRLMLALILSLSAFVQFTVVSRTVVDYPLRADAGEYFSYAYNLHNFGVYSSQRPQSDAAPPTSLIPDKVRSPGYPLFLLSLGAPEPTDAYLRRVCFAQAFLGVLSVWLVFLISATFLGHGPGLAVALLAAVSPHLATMSTYLLTESLFTFLLLGSVFTLLKAVESQKRWLYAVTGVIWGLCALVRPTAEYFPALLLLLVLALPRLRHYKSNAILAFACFLLVLSPWVIRNQSGAVSNPESNLIVNTLAHGSYPGFMYDNRPETFGFPYRFDPRINDITRDLPSILKHIAGKFRAEPLVYTQWYLLGKPFYFLSWGNVQASDVLIYPAIHTPYYEDLRFALMRLLGLALHWPLMILGLAGAAMAVLRPRWLRLEPPAARAAAITALLVAYAIALHMIVAPFPRYAIPFRPFIYALAALPLREAWLALRAGRARFRNPPPSGSL